MAQDEKPETPPPETRRDYEVGYCKPPLHSRFKKGQSGNPRGRPVVTKSVAGILLDALNQRVVVAENGRCRRITKREAMIVQLVNKSATADLRATKMLLDMLRDVEHQAAAASPVDPTAAETLDLLKAKLRRLAEEHDQSEPELPPDEASPKSG
jgi:Family of unknown function (DUF5681)